MSHITERDWMVRYDLGFIEEEEEDDECDICGKLEMKGEYDLLRVHRECLQLIASAQGGLIQKVDGLFGQNLHGMSMGYKGAINLVKRVLINSNYSIKSYLKIKGESYLKTAFDVLGVHAALFVREELYTMGVIR